jgi:hypothetical protein
MDNNPFIPTASNYLVVYRSAANDSVRRSVLYNILTECGIPMKLIRLIKMCLNENCSKVSIGKN